MVLTGWYRLPTQFPKVGRGTNSFGSGGASSRRGRTWTLENRDERKRRGEKRQKTPRKFKKQSSPRSESKKKNTKKNAFVFPPGHSLSPLLLIPHSIPERLEVGMGCRGLSNEPGSRRLTLRRGEGSGSKDGAARKRNGGAQPAEVPGTGMERESQ